MIQPNLVGGAFEDIECFNRSRLHGSDGRKNFVTLKGLSPSEAYLEGILWIALQYSSTRAGLNEFSALALVHHNTEVSKPTACFRPGIIDEFEPVDFHSRKSGDQNQVLVGDIEVMEIVEAELTSNVWLYLVEDCRDDRVAWRSSFLFMSINGAFNRLPILSKREFPVFVELGSVGIAGDMVRVIEGGPEIMNGIAQNRGSVFGKRNWVGSPSLFQKAVVALGPQSLQVLTDVVPKDGFKLTDVMVGPFNL